MCGNALRAYLYDIQMCSYLLCGVHVLPFTYRRSLSTSSLFSLTHGLSAAGSRRGRAGAGKASRRRATQQHGACTADPRGWCQAWLLLLFVSVSLMSVWRALDGLRPCQLQEIC